MHSGGLARSFSSRTGGDPHGDVAGENDGVSRGKSEVARRHRLEVAEVGRKQITLWRKIKHADHERVEVVVWRRDRLAEILFEHLACSSWAEGDKCIDCADR